MPKYKSLQEMLDTGDIRNGDPDWDSAYGPGFSKFSPLLDDAYCAADAIEDREKYLAVVRDEIVPIFIRWDNTLAAETDEATAICTKYNDEETGLFAAMATELDTILPSLPTRYPDLWPKLKEMLDTDFTKAAINRVRNRRWSKVLPAVDGSEDTKAQYVVLNYGNHIRADGPVIKSYRTMSCRLSKRSTLQQQQTQLVKQLLEENGLQLPPEFAAIQQQLDDLKRPHPEEELAQSNTDKGQDECPDAKSFQLFEGVEGSGKFVGIYQSKAKPFTRPPPSPPKFDIYQCQKLLNYLKKGNFINAFMQRPTEEEAPGYSSVVTRHRDIPTIQGCLRLTFDRGTVTTNYEEQVFFGDLRLMIENYRHFFDEDSYEYDCALRLEKAAYEKLAEMGSPGETGKALFDEAVLPEFNDPVMSEPDDPVLPEINDPEPEENADVTLITIQDDDTQIMNLPSEVAENEESSDKNGESGDMHEESDDEVEETVDESDNNIDPDEQETSFAQGINNVWASDYGDEREHSLRIEDDYFNHQDGDGDEGSPVDQTLRPLDPSSPSPGEDNTLDMAWQGMYKAVQYDKNVGNPTRAPVRHNTQRPGGSSSAQPPSPRLGGNEPGDQTAGEFSFLEGEHDYINPDSPGFAAPADAAVGQRSADDTLGSLHLSSYDLEAPSEAIAGEASPDNTLGSIPNPYSDDLTSSPQAAAGEGDMEGTYANAHASYRPAHIAAVGSEQSASHQPAPIASMVAEPPTIDLTSPPQAQTTHTGSASNKRARDSDDQDSSDDDAPLIKRRKTAGMASVSAADKGKAPASAADKGKAPASDFIHRWGEGYSLPPGVTVLDPYTRMPQRARKSVGGRALRNGFYKNAAGIIVPKPWMEAQLAKERAEDEAKGKTPSSAADKGKARASASASSSRKRRRDDDSDAESDDGADGDYVPEQPSKRQRKTASKGKTPTSAAEPTAPATASKGKGKAPAIASSVSAQPPVPFTPAAAGAVEFDDEATRSTLLARIPKAIEAARQQQLLNQEDSLPPSPALEPLTPERVAATGHRSMSPDRAESPVAGPSHHAAAAQPQADPATTALDHTDQGAITVTQLHRLPKWRRSVRTANRPWVFGYTLDDQYGLYIMRCPSPPKACPKAHCTTGPEVFSKNPMIDNNAALHLEECTGEPIDGDTDKMVRQFCKQVISDDKKAVSIEWARKWNNDLIDEYGYEADDDLRESNF